MDTLQRGHTLASNILCLTYWTEVNILFPFLYKNSTCLITFMTVFKMTEIN